jgi:hypothetical protein
MVSVIKVNASTGQASDDDAIIICSYIGAKMKKPAGFSHRLQPGGRDGQQSSLLPGDDVGDRDYKSQDHHQKALGERAGPSWGRLRPGLAADSDRPQAICHSQCPAGRSVGFDPPSALVRCRSGATSPLRSGEDGVGHRGCRIDRSGVARRRDKPFVHTLLRKCRSRRDFPTGFNLEEEMPNNHLYFLAMMLVIVIIKVKIIIKKR